MSARTVGVIGVGQMGCGIARRLDAAGRLGAVWDASATPIEAARLSSEVALARPSRVAPGPQ